MNFILALALVFNSLVSYDVVDHSIGPKKYTVFELTTDHSELVDYAASFEVTYNTPTGLQVVGYVVVIPAGDYGALIFPFMRNSSWTIDHWEFKGYGEYNDGE